MRDILCSQSGPFTVSHKSERFLYDLAKAILDITGKLFDHVPVQRGYTDCLGDIDDIVCVPDGCHGMSTDLRRQLRRVVDDDQKFVVVTAV